MPKPPHLKIDSTIAFLVVLVISAGGFLWWFKNRPSYLLRQAYSQLGEKNQSKVISEYKRLLKSRSLPAEEEIRIRLALGRFYLDAVSENSVTYLIGHEDPTNKVESPFIDLAKKELDQVLELDPKNSEVHCDLGRIFWYRKMESFAMEEFKKSSDLDPKNPNPIYYRSLIELDRANIAQGLDLALQAVALAPTYDPAREALVEAYYRMGFYDKSFAEYEKLSSGYRSTPYVRIRQSTRLAEQNYWPEAESEITEASRLIPKDNNVREHKGRIQLLKGERDSASAEFKASLDLTRVSAWPYMWLTVCYASNGQCEDAKRISELLLEELPQWPWGLWARAHIYLCEGDGEKALLMLDEALKRSPYFREGLQLKIEILMDQARYKDVGTLVRPLLDKKIQESDAYTYLAQSLYFQHKDDLAYELAEKALEAASRNPWPYVWMGLISLRRNETDTARRRFDQALALNKYDRNIQAFWAYFKFKTEEGEEAFQILNSNLKLDSRNATLWHIKGELERERSYFREAIQSYLNAVRVKPYSLKAHLGLLSAYVEIGQSDLASLTLGNCLKINSQNEEVLEWKRKLKVPSR